MLDVTAIGELLIDLTATKTGSDGYPVFSVHPGGAPANFLATLSGLGAKTALIGKVGADAFGALLVGTLNQLGVQTCGVIQAEDVFTTLAFVTLDEKGNRSFSFARKPGADQCLREEEVDWSLIDQARVFHFGSLSLTDEPVRSVTRRAVEYARTRGKLITYDPNLRKPLWKDLEDARQQLLWGLRQADVVKISDDEVLFLFGMEPEEGAKHILREYGAKLVFVTCGGAGCWFANPIARGHVPALANCQAVDTTGAGDIFGGSMVWKLLQYQRPPERLTQSELTQIADFACKCAGLSTTKPGGLSSIPSYEQILRCLNSEGI